MDNYYQKYLKYKKKYLNLKGGELKSLLVENKNNGYWLFTNSNYNSTFIPGDKPNIYKINKNYNILKELLLKLSELEKKETKLFIEQIIAYIKQNKIEGNILDKYRQDLLLFQNTLIDTQPVNQNKSTIFLSLQNNNIIIYDYNNNEYRILIVLSKESATPLGIIFQSNEGKRISNITNNEMLRKLTIFVTKVIEKLSNLENERLPLYHLTSNKKEIIINDILSNFHQMKTTFLKYT